jgi:hypothetical protein
MGAFQKNRWILLPLLAVLVAVTLIFSADTIEEMLSKSKTSDDRMWKELENAAFLEEGKDIEEVTVKLCLDAQGRVIGAAVICQGGEDPATKASIVRLLSAALGLPTNKIEVSGKG